MQAQALSALVAWVRLEAALDAFNGVLRARHGLTGLQLAVLRILRERPQLPLAALRKALVMHPATLGQAIDALRRKKLVSVATDPRDRRARLVSLTAAGSALVEQAPLAGPMRLREVSVAPERLDALSAALGDALELFGLAEFTPDKTSAAKR